MVVPGIIIRGYRLPCLDRGSYVYNPTELSIPYAGMLDNLIGNWMDSFTPRVAGTVAIAARGEEESHHDGGMLRASIPVPVGSSTTTT